MNKLKFAKDEGSEFYKELKAETEKYFAEKGIDRTGGNTMLLKIILYFGLVCVFYALMITSSSLFPFFCFYLLMGLSVLLTAFNISHDAAHGVAVKSKFWNTVLFSFSFNLQGNNAYVWGKNHNESHHLYTNIEGSDIDVLNNPLFRMTATQPLKWFHRYQHIYAPFLYLLYSLNWFLFRETLMIFNYSSRTIKIDIPRKEIVKLVLFKFLYIGYMIVLPIMVLPFGWKIVLLAFLLNHFIISWIFVAVLGVSHLSDYVSHPEPDENNELHMSWPKLQMCTSVDYNADSIFFNWTLGGFNAHALHHLLPNISHVHYLEILPIFRRLAAKHGITYMEMPYRDSLAAHFRFLKAMGRQKEITPRVYKPGKLLVAASLAILLCMGFAGNAQEYKNVFPVGTYHIPNTTINGVSVGFLTIPGDHSGNTNGLKIELVGSGLALMATPYSPVSESAQEYKEVMDRSFFTNNGLVLSFSGSICDCVTNGISLGMVGHLNREVNGISGAGIFNYAEKHNGIQLCIFVSGAYQTAGLQSAITNTAIISDGIQLGINNKSKQHKGLQLGLINRAKKHSGLQLGLWNVNEKRTLPFINWNI